MRQKPFPGEIERVKYGRIALTTEQVAWLRWAAEWNNNKRIVRKIGISEGTLHMLFRKYGISRSPEAMHRIMKYHGKLCSKRISKALKGRKPTANAIEYTRIYRATHKHPLEILHEQNPAKYEQVIRKRSLSRRILIEKENRRLSCGLSRQTKLTNVKLYKYTHKQTCFRSNMKMSGYILGDTNGDGIERLSIFYDDTTTRRPRAEKNAARYGFKIRDINQA